MSNRRPQTPRPSARGAANSNAQQQRRGGGMRDRLERLRVPPERATLDAAPGMRSVPARQRGRATRKKQGFTKWQVFSISIMLVLGLALIVSTFLPYITGPAAPVS